jgi:hypothetical protein
MTDAQRIQDRVKTRLARQRALVRTLLALREQVRGSVFARQARCGKPRCACRRGRSHGPYYVFSNRSGGAGQFVYLDATRVAKARDLVERSRRFGRGLRELQKLNHDVVRLLKRYQGAMARRGSRQLVAGLPGQKGST